jgi:hypothetical protein
MRVAMSKADPWVLHRIASHGFVGPTEQAIAFVTGPAYRISWDHASSLDHGRPFSLHGSSAPWSASPPCSSVVRGSQETTACRKHRLAAILGAL